MTPTASPTEAGDGSLKDTIWTVVVSDLVVRTEPSVANPGTILPARLTEGDRVLAVDGPVAADGYEWYQVLPIRPDGLRERPFGWVASASRDGEPWLVLEDLTCPVPAEDVTAFLTLAPEERLACYGGESIRFRAAVGGCGAGGGFPVSYEPRWLMSESGCGLGREPGDITLMLRLRPGNDSTIDQGPFLDIVGHFDDPAAATCFAIANYPGVRVPTRDEAVAQCRTQFVVESARGGR